MNKIKTLRMSAGLSQNELADILEVNQTAISQWERGATSPGFDSLQRLADYFEVTADYLLGRTNDPTPPNAKSPVYDDEALELMEQMHKRPELKVLFSTSKKASKADIEAVDKLLKHMSGWDDDDD